MFPTYGSAAGWLLLGLLLVLSPLAMAQPISEAEVETFLEEVETALRNRDMEAVAETLAPSATLHFIVRSQDGDEPVILDRDSYMRSISRTLGSVDDYQFSVTVQEIRIENEGQQAQIQLTVREHLVWPDREQSSTTMETVVVERIDGRLRATEIRGVVLMDDEPQGLHLTLHSGGPQDFVNITG